MSGTLRDSTVRDVPDPTVVVDTPEQAAARRLVETNAQVTHVADDGMVDIAPAKAVPAGKEDYSLHALLEGNQPRTMSISEAMQTNTFVEGPAPGGAQAAHDAPPTKDKSK